MDYIRASGPEAFYDNPSQLGLAISTLQSRISTYLFSLGQGGIHWFRDVQNVPWGMVEVRSGTYRFGFATRWSVTRSQSAAITSAR